MEEIWVDIHGYEGLYQVSNTGKIKALPKYYKTGEYYGLRFQGEKILKPYSTGRYLVVELNNGKPKAVKVHRVVAEHFVGNNENKPEVNHIDGNRLNNRADNLEWCTRSENQSHAYRSGLQKIKTGGELSWTRRVINTNTNFVYERMTDAAKDFNISHATLSRYLNNKRPNKTPLRFL